MLTTAPCDPVTRTKKNQSESHTTLYRPSSSKKLPQAVCPSNHFSQNNEAPATTGLILFKAAYVIRRPLRVEDVDKLVSHRFKEVAEENGLLQDTEEWK